MVVLAAFDVLAKFKTLTFGSYLTLLCLAVKDYDYKSHCINYYLILLLLEPGNTKYFNFCIKFMDAIRPWGMSHQVEVLKNQDSYK